MSAAKYKVLSPCAITSADGESTVLEREFGKEVVVPNKDQADALVAGGFLEPVAESRVDEVPDTAVRSGETPDPNVPPADEGGSKPRKGRSS
jgi:hypothetical protein